MSVADVLAAKRGWHLETGDWRERARAYPDGWAHTCVTSPPYWGLRDYGVAGQIGQEERLEDYVESLVAAFRDVHRCLRPDGTLWLNIGDCYANDPGNGRGEAGAGGSKPHRSGTRGRFWALPRKNLIGVPWRVAFALQADGWILRSAITWCKRSPMPEPVTDRPTSATEQIFLFAKRARYYYNAVAAAEPAVSTAPSGNGYARAEQLTKGGPGQAHPWQPTETRNARNYWLLSSEPYPDAHFAVFPTEIPRRAILAGSPEGGIVLDPFAGSGTTLMVALRLGRRAVGVELSPKYAEMATRRIFLDSPLFNVEHEVPA